MPHNSGMHSGRLDLVRAAIERRYQEHLEQLEQVFAGSRCRFCDRKLPQNARICARGVGCRAKAQPKQG